MQTVVYQPIGIIRSPFKTPKGTPIQPVGAVGQIGRLELIPEFSPALESLAGFSHIYLIYHFHLAKTYTPSVVPFLDDRARGLFATRAPARPNPIGLSVVRLEGIEATTLHVKDIDVVDGTPLLDIKPYVPVFDKHEADRIGWLAEKSAEADGVTDDGRFSE